jgi:hypothetical protein
MGNHHRSIVAHHPTEPAPPSRRALLMRVLTILPIDTNGYIPLQNPADPRERRALNSTITARPMARDDVGWIMPENDCEAVAEFIRTKGITRCPTACVLPTQGLVAAADRVALEEHAIARDRLRRAQAAARWRPFLNVKAPHVTSPV